MDSSQRRLSGIPRPSRLPRPVSGIIQPAPAPAPASSSTSSLRPRPSRDSLAGDTSSGTEIQNPKLRASASRGQLRPSAGTNSGRAPALRNSTSSNQLRSSSSRAPAPASKPAAPVSKPVRAVSSSQRRWSTITNAPAAQYKPWAEPAESDRGSFDQETDSTEAIKNDILISYLNDSADVADQFDNNASPLSSPGRSMPQINTPKPSLSERTIETLSQLPSSPALSKKSSSFFDSGRPISRAESSASRPSSSYTSDGSARHPSRPGSSAADDSAFSNPRMSSANLFKRNSIVHNDRTPGAASNSTQRLRPASRASGAASKPSASMPDVRSPSPNTMGRAPAKPAQKPAQKPAVKTLKQRASVHGLGKKPSVQALGASENSGAPISSWDGTIAPAAAAVKEDTEPEQPTQKSSSALRDQIAKAKAAKRAAMKQPPAQTASVTSTTDDFAALPAKNGFDYSAAFDDPFNLNKGQDAGEKVLKQRIGAARTSGKLNIAALGLKEIPSEVMKMYDLETMGAGESWAESVELTRLVGADNEIETLDDTMFPDRSPEELENDEEGRGNIFGGLETLDMHGNRLLAIPMGFRRFTQLTTLNLSSNRLENGCLEIIAQMTAIRDLKLANNLLVGALNADLADLSVLEVLDVHGNQVTALPPNVEGLSRLRVLNLSENNFESLPFEGLSKLPLAELDLKKNKLSGTLIDGSVGSLPMLQSLDISVNRLTRLMPADTSISLPLVHTLTLSMNRLQELPDMTSWTSLINLAADANNISSIPLSFTSLEKVRQADFSSNDIRVVPPEISRMDSLTLLRLSGNPLRDKKFASASTDEIKEALSTRLEPPPPYEEPVVQAPITTVISPPEMEKKQQQPDKVSTIHPEETDSRSEGDDDFATPPTSAPHSPTRSRAQTVVRETWQVKPGGLLDRSRTESSSLSPEMCAELSRSYQIRQAQLHHNLLSAFPGSLQFFSQTLTSLSLGHNKISGEDYLTEELSLPVLTELNLSSNTITSLGPLTKFLKAPALEKIDVSLNRLTALPLDLKQSFPSLKVLLASNNQLTELDPAAIKGLKVVDVASNEIAHLDPRLGLLGGKDGLERLEVAGNRFKVPKWNILEKGTAATMRWLRGRVPAAEMEAWRAENGDDDSSDVD
ncbi:Leucine-rich repeat-containing protein 40 [Trichoderma lentiforme]|uniref:Leucine-rich repeat-containing protein 40 n=1 Tax=Trichoderma lentiforme TaxID=1567552 RepID=A0A9P4XCD5_9HYPO|nr:Leucine-rich repeat-containing protein 40 [Trichoderma lentiforme]